MAKYAASSSKPPVTNYQSIWSCISEDRNLPIGYLVTGYKILHFCNSYYYCCCYYYYYFYYCPVGAFAKLRKATASFSMSVRLEDFQLSLDWFSWNLKIQVSPKRNRYFTWTPMYIYDNISLSSSWKGNVSDKICRDYQNYSFIFITFFFIYSCCFMR